MFLKSHEFTHKDSNTSALELKTVREWFKYLIKDRCVSVSCNIADSGITED